MFNKSVCHRIRAHLDLLPKCRCKLMHSKLFDKQNDDELVIFSFKRSVFRFMDACNKRSQKWGWVNNGGPLLTRYQLYYGDLMWLVDFNSFCSGSLMWMASLILLVYQCESRSKNFTSFQSEWWHRYELNVYPFVFFHPLLHRSSRFTSEVKGSNPVRA